MSNLYAQSGRLVRRDNPAIQIAGTVERLARITTIGQGRIDDNGRVDFEASDEAIIGWIEQANLQRTGERVFLDEHGLEVLEADVVILLDTGQLLFPFHPWKRHA
jgi:hypothetical protein